jgi:aromatic-L-amino-acid decarboxylase
MKIRDFRSEAHRLADWMADYLESVDQFPVKAQQKPGSIFGQLPVEPPVEGELFEEIFRDFRDVIVPGMTHWQHPSFFAYFNANSSPPSILAEMLTATLGAQCMSWETSPAATELEQVTVEWIRRMIGLPEVFTGSIQDTASTATLQAVLAARERVTGGVAGRGGLSGHPSLATYTSAEAHSSVDKAVRLAGLGSENLRKIQVDAQLGMDARALDRAIAADRQAGKVPTCVVATFGTTGTGAMDPIREIASVTRRHDVWLHVDAAWAGSALILPEHRGLADGIDEADSVVFNPHKWLFTNFDCSILYVRDVQQYVETFAATPEYLRTRVDSRVTNYRDWGIQLGRRFRALKLWFVVRSYGVSGLQSMLRQHVALAEDLAGQIGGERDFEIILRPTLSLVCFRYVPGGFDDEQLDDLNERLLHKVNDSGKLYITHTRVKGHFVIRFVIGQTYTGRRHVEEGWKVIRETARSLVG